MLEINDIRDLRDTLRKLEREMDYQLSEQGNCCNVTIEQCHTILELGKKEEEINLKKLAALLGLDKSTVSRGINSLVKADLVVRGIDEKNRRNISLSLSEKGQITCNSINSYCDSYYIDIFNKIPETKQKQVIESLGLFVDAMLLSKKESSENCVTQCDRSKGGNNG